MDGTTRPVKAPVQLLEERPLALCRMLCRGDRGLPVNSGSSQTLGLPTEDPEVCENVCIRGREVGVFITSTESKIFVITEESFL